MDTLASLPRVSSIPDRDSNLTFFPKFISTQPPVSVTDKKGNQWDGFTDFFSLMTTEELKKF